ncbi:hypothetical protein Tco_0843360 [Tanacetum coccineum]|uniref:Reverse transcriptase domain-containing protein n=1 Tax=Tanacetum coccineum TaxID=301880 RepID=A0ABQ5B5U1_9ASTR
MLPRRFKKKSVRKIVEKRVAKAIEKYEKTKADTNNAGGSGSTNTGGTVVPEMQGYLYKTFMNGKLHSFKGTEGVVRLKRWFEKMKQVFEICKCAEDDKLVSTEKKKIEKYIRGFPERIKGNITSSKPATLHEAINMARELVEQSVQGRAARIVESNKRRALQKSLPEVKELKPWKPSWRKDHAMLRIVASDRFRDAFSVDYHSLEVLRYEDLERNCGDIVKMDSVFT